MARYRSVQVPSPYIEQLRAHDATLRQSLCDLDLAPTVVERLMRQRVQLASIFSRYSRDMLDSYAEHLQEEALYDDDTP